MEKIETALCLAWSMLRAIEDGNSFDAKVWDRNLGNIESVLKIDSPRALYVKQFLGEVEETKPIEVKKMKFHVLAKTGPKGKIVTAYDVVDESRNVIERYSIRKFGYWERARKIASDRCDLLNA